MFRRTGGLVVTQSEHSRLAGEIARRLGATLRVSVESLAGAIALHDWPHFGGSHADTIEIGEKSVAQQRELAARLSGPLPLDSFTELIVRLHWQRLSDDAGIELQRAIDQDRIDQLLEIENLTQQQASSLDAWTDFCDALAFYLSLGRSWHGEFHLPAPCGDIAWHLGWETLPDVLTVMGVLQPMDCELSLVAYRAADYPQILSPVMQSVSCKFGA